VIGLPFNDYRCLGSITELVAELVGNGDPVLTELATKHATTEGLANWIRDLPQRDDDGAPGDGPKVKSCDPPQRLRLPAPDPNCVERAALYLGVAELIDPKPARQLATLDTPVGMHTFPIEHGVPVILDPRVPASCLDCGLAAAHEEPVAVEARDAIEWTAQLAEAGAAPMRNGPNRVRRARNAIVRLVDEGVAPADAGTTEAIAWMLALAERVARKYGPRALAIVRTTAQAVAQLADDALARVQRNVALDLFGLRVDPANLLSGLGQIAARVGVDVGATVIRSKLGALGIGSEVIGELEQEFNREGLTLGPLASSPRLSALGSLASKRAA